MVTAVVTIPVEHPAANLARYKSQIDLAKIIGNHGIAKITEPYNEDFFGPSFLIMIPANGHVITLPRRPTAVTHDASDGVIGYPSGEFSDCNFGNDGDSHVV